MDADDEEVSDCVSLSAGEGGMGQCGRSRTHTGDTRMDSGRLLIAYSSESTDSSSTASTLAPSAASRHSEAAAYDQRSSSELSLHGRERVERRLRFERGDGVTGGAEVQRVSFTCARGETRAGSPAVVDDSKPMVGEMESSAAGLTEVGSGGRQEEVAPWLRLAGDCVEVDQP